MPTHKCYPAGNSAPLRIAGIVLVALGALLLFICIPYWAWLALFGVGLIAVGFVLLRCSNTGR